MVPYRTPVVAPKPAPHTPWWRRLRAFFWSWRFEYRRVHSPYFQFTAHLIYAHWSTLSMRLWRRKRRWAEHAEQRAQLAKQEELRDFVNSLNHLKRSPGARDAYSKMLGL